MPQTPTATGPAAAQWPAQPATPEAPRAGALNGRPVALAGAAAGDGKHAGASDFKRESQAPELPPEVRQRRAWVTNPLLPRAPIDLLALDLTALARSAAGPTQPLEDQVKSAVERYLALDEPLSGIACALVDAYPALSGATQGDPTLFEYVVAAAVSRAGVPEKATALADFFSGLPEALNTSGDFAGVAESLVRGVAKSLYIPGQEAPDGNPSFRLKDALASEIFQSTLACANPRWLPAALKGLVFSSTAHDQVAAGFEEIVGALAPHLATLDGQQAQAVTRVLLSPFSKKEGESPLEGCVARACSHFKRPEQLEGFGRACGEVLLQSGATLDAAASRLYRFSDLRLNSHLQWFAAGLDSKCSKQVLNEIAKLDLSESWRQEVLGLGGYGRPWITESQTRLHQAIANARDPTRLAVAATLSQQFPPLDSLVFLAQLPGFITPTVWRQILQKVQADTELARQCGPDQYYGEELIDKGLPPGHAGALVALRLPIAQEKLRSAIGRTLADFDKPKDAPPQSGAQAAAPAEALDGMSTESSRAAIDRFATDIDLAFERFAKVLHMDRLELALDEPSGSADPTAPFEADLPIYRQVLAAELEWIALQSAAVPQNLQHICAGRFSSLLDAISPDPATGADGAGLLGGASTAVAESTGGTTRRERKASSPDGEAGRTLAFTAPQLAPAPRSRDSSSITTGKPQSGQPMRAIARNVKGLDEE